jgi:hypothetical protein
MHVKLRRMHNNPKSNGSDAQGMRNDDEVRNVGLRLPDDLYDRLRALAEAERRSLNSEAIVLLERAIAAAERERREPGE